MSTDNDIFAVSLASDFEFTITALETAKEFGNVNVRKSGDNFQIQFTLLMEPQKQLAKVWKTGVAMDSSASMKKVFGRRMVGNIPDDIAQEYKKKGWVTRENRDGRKVKSFQRAAVNDAVERGLVSLSPNTMDFLAPEFVGYLSGHMDIDGETSLIYWAGGNGADIEMVGDIKEDEAAILTIDGPDTMMFGDNSRLLPAVKYFAEKYRDAPGGMFVFITDGQIDDLPELKQYTIRLAQEIMADKRNLVKCILVGIGDEIDENKIQELTSLDTKTYVNVWDHMIASDLQDLLKIFTEVIKHHQIVAPNGTIYDAQGNILKKYEDGLPGRVVFSMPVSSPWFELEFANQRIRQIVTIPKYILGGKG